MSNEKLVKELAINWEEEKRLSKMKTIFKHLKDKQVEENKDLFSIVLNDLRVCLQVVASEDVFQGNIGHHQRYPKKK